MFGKQERNFKLLIGNWREYATPHPPPPPTHTHTHTHTTTTTTTFNGRPSEVTALSSVEAPSLKIRDRSEIEKKGRGGRREEREKGSLLSLILDPRNARLWLRHTQSRMCRASFLSFSFPSSLRSSLFHSLQSAVPYLSPLDSRVPLYFTRLISELIFQNMAIKWKDLHQAVIPPWHPPLAGQLTLLLKNILDCDRVPEIDLLP